MTTPETSRPRPRGLRLHDLVGLVVGYGMAALLTRSFWPSNKPFVGIPAIALGLEYFWLGLAMSGPIVLLIDRKGSPTPPRTGRPKLGRLISSKEPEAPIPVGRGPARQALPETSRYTRAELAWMLIGGYWIALTMLVVPALSIGSIAGLVGMVQLLIALTLVFFVVPRRVKPGTSAESWTHSAALGLLWTWPIAWFLLIVLSRGF